MKKKEVLDTLKLDQILIDESFRRLVEGICCLKFEDHDYAWDLFDKAARAVREHIKIEEEVFAKAFCIIPIQISPGAKNSENE